MGVSQKLRLATAILKGKGILLILWFQVWLGMEEYTQASVLPRSKALSIKHTAGIQGWSSLQVCHLELNHFLKNLPYAFSTLADIIIIIINDL